VSGSGWMSGIMVPSIGGGHRPGRAYALSRRVHGRRAPIRAPHSAKSGARATAQLTRVTAMRDAAAWAGLACARRGDQPLELGGALGDPVLRPGSAHPLVGAWVSNS
jgi:hypothetical protein